ncbi:DNA-directed RNA polymerase III subunit rpc25, variant 2 [Bonamia ostreae]|uniref:DNA-directed RNA polymerase III subunit rpc25, variant 2 n=1 Tax=Bonamia ostreae TaxID=126728 RepID=A0ABV2ANT8_9EUKA
MFKEVVFKDIIFIEPKYFGQNHLETIKDIINIKFLNKVIKDVGLCTSIRSINDIGAPHILKGTGREQVTVIFSLIVFSPFPGEVLVGTVDYADRSGLISLTLKMK